MAIDMERDGPPMRLAIEASRAALRAGDMPFGAVLAAPDGRVLHVARNRQASGRDLTAHAELALVREVEAKGEAGTLRGATVYASGEPCAMCCGAMFWAGIVRVVYAASTAEIGAALGGPSLPANAAQVLRGATPPVQVDGPLLGDDAVAVLRGAGGSA